MAAFDFESYKDFLNATIEAMPRGGRGQKLRIAEILGVHTTMITHVLSGHAHFGVEHGVKLAKYFGLNDLETEYFIDLIQYERAGDHGSRAFFKKRMHALREKAQSVANRVSYQKVLTEAQQAIFYSSWTYSAIRLATAIEGCDTPAAIAEYLDLPLSTVQRIVEFLTQHGLLFSEDGRLQIGPATTYLPFGSPLTARLHQNWRVKALEHLESVGDDELSFTNAIVVSREDVAKIRELFVQTIEKFRAIADPSSSEELCYFNLDWHRLKRLK